MAIAKARPAAVARRPFDRRRASISGKRKPVRYRHIAEVLASEIAAGRPSLGNLMPSEAELCDRFQSSRHTVREALRILVSNGLIVRRAGAGSIVVSTSEQIVLVPSLGTVEPVLNVPSSVVRKKMDARYVEAHDQLAEHLRCPRGTAWFKLREIRYSGLSAGAYPVGVLDIYVLPQYATVATHKSYLKIPVHLQIERLFKCSLDHADVSIFAATVPANLASALKVEPGSAALRVIRRYFDGSGRMYEVTSSISSRGALHLHADVQEGNARVMPDTRGRGADASVEDMIAAADNARLDALISGDISRTEALLADDLIYTHPDGRRDTKQSYLASLRSGSVKFVAIERGEPIVTSRNGIGWVQRDLTLHRIKDEHLLKVRLGVLSVWEQSHSGWRLVSYLSTRSN